MPRANHHFLPPADRAYHAPLPSEGLSPEVRAGSGVRPSQLTWSGRVPGPVRPQGCTRGRVKGRLTEWTHRLFPATPM